MLEQAIRTLISDEVRRVLDDLLPQLLRASAPPLPTTPAADRHLTFAQAAALAGVSVATINRWIRSGQLKQYGTGRLARVSHAELLRFREMQVRPASGDSAIEKKAQELLRGGPA